MGRYDWTDEQNDVTVAEYFDVFAAELEGRPVNKAATYRALGNRIGRSPGAAARKFGNVSAALRGLGQTWVSGIPPLPHLQQSLIDAVRRWIDQNPTWLAEIGTARLIGISSSLNEPSIWIGPPPTLGNQPLSKEAEEAIRIARQFNVAERDERNRALGRAGEERVLVHERTVLEGAGRDDLAEAVRWVSEEEGDGLGYDIASFESDGRDRLIEVKTTNGWERTPFHISRNELAVADANRDAWCLLRLYNFAREPRAFEIRPPLERHVELTPTSFQASLR